MQRWFLCQSHLRKSFLSNTLPKMIIRFNSLKWTFSAILERTDVQLSRKKNTEEIILAFSLLQHAYCQNLQKRIKGPVKHLKLYYRCFTRSIDHLYCYLVSFFPLHKLGKLPSSKGRNTCKTLLAVVFSR